MNTIDGEFHEVSEEVTERVLVGTKEFCDSLTPSKLDALLNPKPGSVTYVPHDYFICERKA